MSRAIALPRRETAQPHLIALGCIVGLGAALRFATLDLQSYRYDEAVTVARVLHPSLFDTLSAVPGSESTPPLYYAVAWLWSRIFGTGEVGLRSLSALAGTVTILVVYLAGAELLSRRAGLIAAAIVAVNPAMVWFSQDARAYALVVLLVALSLLFFGRSLREPSARTLTAWAVSSALALATHYFAAFVVGPEALLLIALTRERRRVLLATGAVAAVAGLLLPIAIEQAGHGHASWIADQPLSQRTARAAGKLVGDDNGGVQGPRPTGPIPLVVPIAIALAGIALLVARGDPAERRGAGIAAAVGLGGVAAVLLLALLGHDYFEGRNLMPLYIPLMVLIAAGFAVRRAPLAGMALACVFCLCGLVYTLEIDRLPRLQREDLRNAAEQIGPRRVPRAVVTVRHAANWPLRYYLDLQPARSPLRPLREIDLVGSRSAIDSHRRVLPRAFHLVEEKGVSYNYTLARLRAARPVAVPLSVLRRGDLVGGGATSSVLVDEPPAR